MGLSSCVTNIHTIPQPSPDASMKIIYAVSPSIISVHLVGSVDAACSTFCISPTNCLISVYLVSFVYAVSIPDTFLLV